MRPVRPEPEERPKIKRAMRAARIMKGAELMFVLVLLAAIIVGRTTEWYFGVGVLVVSLPFFILGSWPPVVRIAVRCGGVRARAGGLTEMSKTQRQWTKLTRWYAGDAGSTLD